MNQNKKEKANCVCLKGGRTPKRKGLWKFDGQLCQSFLYCLRGWNGSCHVKFMLC